MAAQTAIKTQHATLSTTVVDSVTLSGAVRQIAVTNRDGSNVAWVTVGSAPADPVASADETFVIPVSSRKVVWVSSRARSNMVVKILGNGGAYSVEGTDWID